MTDQISNAVRAAAEDDIFKAIGLAALKARASGLKPGEIIRTGGYEMVVAEDEEGVGTVVLLVQGKDRIESLAFDKAEELGIRLGDMEERRDWMALFMKNIKEYLEKWYQIRMLPGPGENFTFEKAVYKRDDSWR